MDQIIIKGLRIFAYHGVNPEEKRNGQDFTLDVSMGLCLKKPGESDRLEDTVNYANAVKCVGRAMTERSYDLLECAASHVARALLEEFPAVRQVTVLLKKPQAPIQADFTDVEVEIQRSRGDF